MSNGSEIQAEIAAAMIEASSAVGDGPLYCTLRKKAVGTSDDGLEDDPWADDASGDDSYPYQEFIATQGARKVRDATGTFIGVTQTTLMFAGGGVIPTKADYVAIGVRKDDVVESTTFIEISDIETNATGGVALSYRIMLAD